MLCTRFLSITPHQRIVRRTKQSNDRIISPTHNLERHEIEQLIGQQNITVDWWARSASPGVLETMMPLDPGTHFQTTPSEL